MTDGETGERYYWISFQTSKFKAMPEFLSDGALGLVPGPSTLPPMPQLHLAHGRGRR